MNEISIFALKALRKTYTKIFGDNQMPPLQRENDPDKVSDMIYNLLMQDKPCMVARFGSTELNAISNYRGIKDYKGNAIGFIKGETPQWWWNEKGLQEIFSCSGFFPPTKENVSRFSEMMINDMPLVDILGSWRPQERLFSKELRNAKFVSLEILNPYWSKQPWTRALKGKKVLVIHPFAETIRMQYNKREKLFSNPETLPQFELHIIKAVQSLGGNDQFKDWFEALEWMKNEMDKIDYEICLIGCGAYGFPLAAYAKRKGKKAVHLAGALQLLFGIKGKRWEDPNYNKKYNYSALMNEYWVKPKNDEKSQNASQVEGGCYW